MNQIVLLGPAAMRTGPDSAVGVKLDGFFASLGMAPHFANGGHGGEVLCGILGILIVLVAGAIWRRRRMAQNTEHVAPAA